MKHLQIMETLHKEGFPEATWMQGLGISDKPVIMLTDLQYERWTGMFFIEFADYEQLTDPKLGMRTNETMQFDVRAATEKIYSKALEKVEHFIGYNGKWRALAEDWEGGVEESYRVILYKDDEKQKYFLRESINNEHRTEAISVYHAKEWAKRYDPGNWTDQRLEKEFPAEMVSSYLKANPLFDPAWKKIGEYLDGDSEQTYIEKLYKDDKENRFFIISTRSSHEYDANEETGRYVLIPSASATTQPKEVTEQVAFDWVTEMDLKGRSNTELKKIFSEKLIDDFNKSFDESEKTQALQTTSNLSKAPNVIPPQSTLELLQKPGTKLDQLINKIAQRFGLKLGNPTVEKANSQQNDHRKHLRL